MTFLLEGSFCHGIDAHMKNPVNYFINFYSILQLHKKNNIKCITPADTLHLFQQCG